MKVKNKIKDKAGIESAWRSRNRLLKITIAIVLIKELLDIVIWLLALIPYIGWVFPIIYNITIGSLVTIIIAFVSFTGGFGNKKRLLTRVIRLVGSFLGEITVSFLPLDTIAMVWIWFEEKNEYLAKVGKEGAVSKLVKKVSGGTAEKIKKGVIGSVSFAGNVPTVISFSGRDNSGSSSNFSVNKILGRSSTRTSGVIKEIKNRRSVAHKNSGTQRDKIKSSYKSIIE